MITVEVFAGAVLASFRRVRPRSLLRLPGRPFGLFAFDEEHFLEKDGHTEKAFGGYAPRSFDHHAQCWNGLRR